jgi:hypothetical protein
VLLCTNSYPCATGAPKCTHVLLCSHVQLCYCTPMCTVVLLLYIEYTELQPPFWRTFRDEGKISPGWWGWGVHAHPLSLHLPSPVKLQCTLQLSGQIHWPCFISTNICTLWYYTPTSVHVQTVQLCTHVYTCVTVQPCVHMYNCAPICTHVLLLCTHVYATATVKCEQTCKQCICATIQMQLCSVQSTPTCTQL